MSDQQCWWRKQRQPQGPDSQAEWRVSVLHPSAPDLQRLSVLTHAKKKKKKKFKRLKDTISQNKSNLIWTPDLRWHWWQTWGVNAGQGSRPTLCGIPQSQPSRRWWPSEWRLRWGRWCPEPDRWKHLQKDTAVLLLLCSALWKEMCRFCHLFRSLFKLYSNGITEE